MNDRKSPFPSREQKERDRQAKREAVMMAAVDMFNERGFHATSLDDVAASLGISKPTIYHYLGNKEQVLVECLRAGLNELLMAAKDAQSIEGNGADRLCHFLVFFAQVNMAGFGRCVIRTGEETLSEGSAKELRRLKRKIHDAMLGMIKDGIDDGSITCRDPTILAFTLAGALNWPARWFDADRGREPADIAAEMVAYLAEGFRPR